MANEDAKTVVAVCKKCAQQMDEVRDRVWLELANEGLRQLANKTLWGPELDADPVGDVIRATDKMLKNLGYE